jgi:hypothetical protein
MVIIGADIKRIGAAPKLLLGPCLHVILIPHDSSEHVNSSAKSHMNSSYIMNPTSGLRNCNVYVSSSNDKMQMASSSRWDDGACL